MAVAFVFNVLVDPNPELAIELILLVKVTSKADSHQISTVLACPGHSGVVQVAEGHILWNIVVAPWLLLLLLIWHHVHVQAIICLGGEEVPELGQQREDVRLLVALKLCRTVAPTQCVEAAHHVRTCSFGTLEDLLLQ